MVDKSEKFQLLVRLGYAARGLVYLTLGYLALTTANRARGGGEAAFEVLQDIPLGTALLWLMAAGLLAYAIFKFISAIGDVQHHGSDAKGLATRVGELTPPRSNRRGSRRGSGTRRTRQIDDFAAKPDAFLFVREPGRDHGHPHFIGKLRIDDRAEDDVRLLVRRLLHDARGLLDFVDR